MKLTRKSEYACLALIELARNYEYRPLKIREITESQSIPKKYLEQILVTLKNNGLVKSTRGASGGYALAKPPKEIHLAEVVRLMDGAIAPISSVSEYYYESSPLEKEEELLIVFKDIRDYAADKLENTTLNKLI